LTLGDPTTVPSGGQITDSGTLDVSSSLSVPEATIVGGGGVVKVGANGSINTDPGSTKAVTFVPQVDNDGTCGGCGVTVTSGTFELQHGDAGSTAGSYSLADGTTLQVDAGTFDAASVTGSGGTVDVAGSSHLTVGSTDTFTPGGLTIGGGSAPTATLNKDVSVGTLTTSTGNRDGTGNLTVTGTLDLAGNFAFAGGTTTIANTVTSSTLATGVTLDGGSTLTLDAPTDRTTNGPIQLGPDNTAATLNINKGFHITGANAPFLGSSSSVVHIGPAGSLTADPGANQETDVEVPINNEGTVTAKTGKLALFDGTTGTNSGGYVIDATATLELEGSAPFESPSITGAGTFFDFGPTATVSSGDTFSPANVQLANGGALTVNRDVTITNLLGSSGGIRNGFGTLTITGSMALPTPAFNGGITTLAGTASALSLDTGSLTLSDAVLNLDTPTTWTGTAIGLGSSSVLNINSTFLDSGTQTMGFGSDSVVHVGPTGSLTIDPGTGKSFLTETQIQNEGTTTIASGTTTSAHFTQSSGTTTVAPGAELDGAVTINGGTLKGSGTLGGPVTNTGGTLAPGSSPGTMTITGAYAQGPFGTLAEEITGTTPGTQFDRLLVGGTLNLDGTLAIDSTSFTPASNDTFKIISGASGRAGTFAAITGATVNGSTYSAQYDADGVTLLVAGPPPPPNQTLSVAFAGTGAGSMSDGASLTCSASCQHQYPRGTVVHLTATAAAGSTFAGWSGGGCSGTGTCTVTMSADQAVTATFSTTPPVAHALTVSKSGTGSGSVSSSPAGINCGSTCSSAFITGTQVTLTATADSGSTFAGWSGGGCSGTGTCTVTMSADQAVTATFSTTPPVAHALTVSKSGTGSGSVSSSPAGINCGSTCSSTFTAATQVTLTATAASGSTFAGWSGGGCSGTGTCTVTMSSDTAVTAGFAANQPPPPPTTRCVVPNLKGKKLGAAKIAIRKAHCSVGKVTKVKSTKKHRDRVISQDPNPGKHLKKGSKVSFTFGT
jgi:hypothetical protein